MDIKTTVKSLVDSFRRSALPVMKDKPEAVGAATVGTGGLILGFLLSGVPVVNLFAGPMTLLAVGVIYGGFSKAGATVGKTVTGAADGASNYIAGLPLLTKKDGPR